MLGLTKRQREIVDFIETYVSEKRHSPSYREIQTYFGFSSLGSVYNHIQSLKKKGLLPENTQQSRSLFPLTTTKSEGIEVPMIGKLRGGMPIETFPQITPLILPAELISSVFTCYALQVIGRELEEEYIREGDLLIVQTKTDFKEGECILVQVGGHTTFIKRGYLDLPYIRLESDNPEVQPMILRQDHVQVLGSILSLLRNY